MLASRRDFGDDRFGGGAGVGGLGHRPADDQIVRAVPDRLARRRHAFLIARGGARRANAGRDEDEAIAEVGAQLRRFGRAGDQSVTPAAWACAARRATSALTPKA